MNMHQPQHRRVRSALVPFIMACTLLQLDSCAEQGSEIPLVLSGDERLHDGVLNMDERDIHASFVDGDLQVSFVVHSSAPLDLANQAAFSLRDLGDKMFASGAAKIERLDDALVISALLNPAPQINSPADQAAYVIHGNLRSGGLVLRFRRSLYAALNHVNFHVAHPSALMPGQDFPLLANFSQDEASTEASVWIFDPQNADDTNQEIEGQAHLQSLQPATPSLYAENFSLDTSLTPGSTLSLRMLQNQSEDNANAGYNNVLHLAELSPTRELRIWPRQLQLIPGHVLSVLINLRQRGGGSMAGQNGQACLQRNHQNLFCQNLRSDAHGLANLKWLIPPSFNLKDALVLHLDFGQAKLERAIELVPQEFRIEDTNVVVTEAWADAQEIHIRGKIPGGQGLRYHLELRAEGSDGPLLAEREGWLRSEDLRTQLAIPLSAHLVPKQWYVLVGVEDSYGRRSSRSSTLLPSSEGLVLQVWRPQQLSQNEDFSLLVATRNNQGQPVMTSGTWQVNSEIQTFVTNENGLALLSKAGLSAAQVELQIQVQDAQGREENWHDTVPLSTNAQDIWPWIQPLQIEDQNSLTVQIRNDSQLRPLAAWLSDQDLLIDSVFADSVLQLERGLAERQRYWLNSLAIDANEQLIAQSQVLLAAHILQINSTQIDDAMQLNLVDNDNNNKAAFFVQLSATSPSPLPFSTPELVQIAEQGAEDPKIQNLVQQALKFGSAESHGLSMNLADDVARQAQTRANQQVDTDLNAIFFELANKIHEGLVDSAEIDNWVQRRTHAYYDPWGQSYLLSLEAGQLRLQSLGLDELNDSGDELQANRFIHALVMNNSSDENNSQQQRGWQQSLASKSVYILGDDGNTQGLQADIDTQVLALTDDGQSVQQRLKAVPIQSVSFPHKLKLRRGDQLVFDLDIFAPQVATLHLDWHVENSDALLIQSPMQLSPGRNGWAHTRVEVQAQQNAAQTILLNISSATQQVVQNIDIQTRDSDADLDVIDSWCGWPDQEQTLQLDASQRAQRQNAVLKAHVWTSGDELSRFLSRHTLLQAQGRRLQNLDEAALYISARNLLTEEQRPNPESWLIYMGSLLRDDGGFASGAKDSKAMFAPSLSALESMQELGQNEPENFVQQAWLNQLNNYFTRALQDDGGLSAEGVSGDAFSLRRQRLRDSARLLAAGSELLLNADQLQSLRLFVRDQALLVNDPLAVALALKALTAQPNAEPNTVANLRDHLWSLQFPVEGTTVGEGLDPAHAGLFIPYLDDGDAPKQYLMLANALAVQSLLANATEDEKNRLVPALNLLLSACSATGIHAVASVQTEILRALKNWPANDGSIILDDGNQQFQLSAEQNTLSQTSVQGQSLHIHINSTPLLSMIWLEARPALPFTKGPNLSIDAPSLIHLRQGRPQSWPLQIAVATDADAEIDPDLNSTAHDDVIHLWSQGASCVDLAVQVGEARHVFAPSQGIDLRLSHDDLQQDLLLWAYPQQQGRCAMPLLRLEELRQPGDISSSRARMLVIE